MLAINFMESDTGSETSNDEESGTDLEDEDAKQNRSD